MALSAGTIPPELAKYTLTTYLNLELNELSGTYI